MPIDDAKVRNMFADFNAWVKMGCGKIGCVTKKPRSGYGGGVCFLLCGLSVTRG